MIVGPLRLLSAKAMFEKDQNRLIVENQKMQLLDGNACSEEIRKEIKNEVENIISTEDDLRISQLYLSATMAQVKIM